MDDLAFDEAKDIIEEKSDSKSSKQKKRKKVSSFLMIFY
jgi:hypothetical protein